MRFYQFFTIFICSTFLILYNAFTATADDPPTYNLTLNSTEGRNCSSQSSPLSSTVQCTAGIPFEKFSINCWANRKLDDDHTIVWYKRSKNRSEPESVIESNDHIEFGDDNRKISFKSLEASDAHEYQCRVVKKGNTNTQPIAQGSINVSIIPRIHGSKKDLNVIEGNPISMVCVVTTSVPVTVKWIIDTPYWKNKEFDTSNDRIRFEANNGSLVTNNELIIMSANMSLDRGTYTCWAYSVEFQNSTTQTLFTLRVKSKYAALWPFLGICAEVVILCVIILIYEKKRDKTELEESDTDQGPETKSSPDHGQDNVRYRK